MIFVVVKWGFDKGNEGVLNGEVFVWCYIFVKCCEFLFKEDSVVVLGRV